MRQVGPGKFLQKVRSCVELLKDQRRQKGEFTPNLDGNYPTQSGIAYFVVESEPFSITVSQSCLVLYLYRAFMYRESTLGFILL